MSKILKALTSRKYAVALLILTAVAALANLYLQAKVARYVVERSLPVALTLLALSLILCNIGRLKVLAAWYRTTSIPRPALGQQRCYQQAAEGLQNRLASLFRGEGYQVRVDGLELFACKHRSGLLGSILFHLGLVILLAGFLVNNLWGYKGAMLLPERVPLKLPEDLQVEKQGWFFRPPQSLFVGLDKFSYQSGTRDSKEPEIQPEALLRFSDERNQWSRAIKINYPIDAGGLSWRYLDSGYSVLLNLSSPDGLVVNDYANIASHNGEAWYDVIKLSDQLQLEINFYPDFAQQGGQLLSQSRLPNNPVLQLTIVQNGVKTGPVLIPMGQVQNVGQFSVAFPDYRYWVALDVGADPGRYLLYLGGALAVVGLLWRTLLITKMVQIKVISQEEVGNTLVLWGSRATYGKALHHVEIEKLLDSIGGALS